MFYQHALVLFISLGSFEAQVPQQTSAAPPAAVKSADESRLLAEGWTLLQKGQVEQAGDKATEATLVSPRGAAPLALALAVARARGGATAALDFYERWLGKRTLEEPASLRGVARALLKEIAAAQPDSAAGFEARRYLAEDGDLEARQELAQRRESGGRAETRVLASLGDPAAVQSLVDEADGPGNPVRAIQALGETGSELAADAVARKLADPRTEVRGAAADALGRIGGPEAIGRLRPLLEDPSLHVRLRAAGALLRLNDASGEPVFREMLEATKDSAPSRLIAAESMAARPDAAWQSLVRGLLDAKEPDVRLRAAALIAPYDADASQEAFRALQDHANPAIRAEAARQATSTTSDLRLLRTSLRASDPLTGIGAAGRILQLTR